MLTSFSVGYPHQSEAISLILFEPCFGNMGSTFQNLCWWLHFFVSHKRRAREGGEVNIKHRKHFLYFSAKMHVGLGQEIVEGGEIARKHDILKG